MVAAAGYLFPPHRNCGLGGNVRDRPQSLARRTAGWRTHCFRAQSAGPSNRVAADHPGADSDGVLFLGGLATVGNPAAHQRHATSHGGGMAWSDSGAALAGGARAAHDAAYVDAGAVRAQFPASGGARDTRSIDSAFPKSSYGCPANF